MLETLLSATKVPQARQLHRFFTLYTTHKGELGQVVSSMTLDAAAQPTLHCEL